MPTLETPNRLLIPKSAAYYIGMSASFLANARCQGNLAGRTPAPPYLKIGRTVRYDVAALDKWINERAQECTR